VVSFFTAADGKLSNFNGSGEGDKAYLKALRKAAPDITAKSFGYCPHTGYQRIEADGTVLIVDTGKTAPRPHDTQAHLAPLAFELSTELGRLVVNCGWNAAQPQSFRRAVRATAAHSTLILNDQSAGRLLKGGWASKCLGEAVAVEAGPVSVTRKEQVTGTWLESSHDSYRDETGLSHRRRFYMSIEGNDIRGEDSLFVPLGRVPLSNAEIPFQIRFHFHASKSLFLVVPFATVMAKRAATACAGRLESWRPVNERHTLALADENGRHSI